MNGINWNLATTTYSFTGYGVAYGNGKWLAVGSYPYGDPNSYTIYSSTDGITWTPSVDTPTNAFYGGIGYGVAFNGTVWVAVGGQGSTGTIFYSGDGYYWNLATGGSLVGSGYVWKDVTWNGSFFVAVGYSGAGGGTTIIYSSDGINWSACSGTLFSWRGEAVASNGGTFVAVGSGTNTILISTDAINWTAVSGTTFTSGSSSVIGGKGITWNGEMWIASGDTTTGPNNILTSRDGTTWSETLNSGVNLTAVSVRSRVLQNIPTSFSSICATIYNQNAQVLVANTAASLIYSGYTILNGITTSASSTNTDQITVPQKGLYNIDISIQVVGTGSAGTLGAWIINSSTTIKGPRRFVEFSSSGNSHLSFTHVLDLNASETILIRVLSTQNCALTASSAGGSFPNNYASTPSNLINIYRIA